MKWIVVAFAVLLMWWRFRIFELEVRIVVLEGALASEAGAWKAQERFNQVVLNEMTAKR